MTIKPIGFLYALYDWTSLYENEIEQYLLIMGMIVLITSSFSVAICFYSLGKRSKKEGKNHESSSRRINKELE